MSSPEELRQTRKIKEADDASSVAGGAKIDETRGGEEQMKGSTKIETGSGVYIGGNVSTGGGDFIGRDKIVYGETLRVDETFRELDRLVEALPVGPSKTMATTAVDGLRIEAKKDENADPDNIQQWFEFLAKTTPAIFEEAVETFSNPIEGIHRIFSEIAKRVQEG